MKLGLISINIYAKGLNFACPLHTYAFQQFLNNNGIDNVVIDYQPVYYDGWNIKYPADYYKKEYEKIIQMPEETEQQRNLKSERLHMVEVRMANWELMREERARRSDKFQAFIERYYRKTDECYTPDLLEIRDPGCDGYICVTDVIWKDNAAFWPGNPGYGFDRGFFLGSRCMENKWKFSYAASRGVPKNFSPKMHKQFFDYVTDIDYISVREPSLKEFIESNSNRSAELVIDPVLLHPKEFYQKISVKPQEEDYVLLYYVMETAIDTVEHAVAYAKKNNLKIVELSDKPLKSKKTRSIEVIHHYNIGPEEWLGYIEHAHCIFTNSFHACCFSILFEKDFFVGDRKGDKVTNILTMFQLSERRLNPNTLIVEDANDIKFIEEQKIELRKKIKLGHLVNKVTLSKWPKLAKKLPKWIQKLERMEKYEYMEAHIDYSRVPELLEAKRAESSMFILDAIRQAELAGEKSKNPKYEELRHNMMYPLRYHSGRAKQRVSFAGMNPNWHKVQLKSGALECWPDMPNIRNNGEFAFEENLFDWEMGQKKGWALRLKIDTAWFWYLEDGSLAPVLGYSANRDGKIKTFLMGDNIPYIPVNHIEIAVAEAVWNLNTEEEMYDIHFHSGDAKADVVFIDSKRDEMCIQLNLKSGALEEYTQNQKVRNNGTFHLKKCNFAWDNHVFAGWRLRVCADNIWYWYMQDGTVVPILKHKSGKVKIFAENEAIPSILLSNIRIIVAEAVWK